MCNRLNVISLLILVVGITLFMMCGISEKNSGESKFEKRSVVNIQKNNEGKIFWVWIPSNTKSGYLSVDTKWGILKVTYDSLYIIDEPSGKDDSIGKIHNLADDVLIASIEGEYPDYTLFIKMYAQYVDIDDEGKIKSGNKWIHGEVVVHFLNDNEIWFENKLDKEFSNRVSYLLKFGPKNIYKRAIVLQEHIKKDLP
ncbi:MAG: hypothetical protein WBK20_03590 [Spirochaetota bacterium]